MNVPAPDDLPSFPDKDFNFTRLGIRIPMLLVSPLVPKGLVISEPTEGEKPAANSEFEATSIISTVRKLFAADNGNAVQPLTRRDAWAATFEDRFTDTPRTDCPMQLPAAPKSLGAQDATREAAQPLNDLQLDIVAAYEALRQRTFPGVESTVPLPTTQGQGSEWIAKIAKDVLEAHAEKYEVEQQDQDSNENEVDEVDEVDEVEVDKLLGNCEKVPYDFCCGVGTPCDCTKGSASPGQCKPDSYIYCCNVGTPCDCTQPPGVGVKVVKEE